MRFNGDEALRLLLRYVVQHGDTFEHETASRLLGAFEADKRGDPPEDEQEPDPPSSFGTSIVELTPPANVSGDGGTGQEPATEETKPPALPEQEPAEEEEEENKP